MSRQSRPAPDLVKWLEENMPDIAQELSKMTLDNVRIRLNQVTGFDIRSSDPIRDSSYLFLGALKTLHAQHQKKGKT